MFSAAVLGGPEFGWVLLRSFLGSLGLCRGCAESLLRDNVVSVPRASVPLLSWVNWFPGDGRVGHGLFRETMLL